MLHSDLIAPIPELLRRHAEARGNKVAYRDAHGGVTYAQLDERTGRLGGHLVDLGLARGDTVARAGAVSVPISYDATEPEIAYRLSDANCRAIVTAAERGELVAKLKAG